LFNLEESSFPFAVCNSGNDKPVTRPIDVHKWSISPKVDDACKVICNEIVLRGDSINKERRRHLKCIILDLFIAHKDNPFYYVAYSRDKGCYAKGSRLNAIHFKYAPTIFIVDVLSSLGYCEGLRGFKDHRTGVGRQSCIKATSKLISLIMGKSIIKKDVFRRNPPVVLRGMPDNNGDKPELQVPDNAEVRGIVKRLERINAVLSSAEVGLNLDLEQASAMLQAMNRTALDTSRNKLHRVFNEGRFDRGGRFYGHWIQGIPREYRRHVVINGEAATEYDFSSHHIRLLYLLSGKTPPDGDLYYVDDQTPEWNKANRQLLKDIILVAINSKDDLETLKAVREKYRKEYGVCLYLDEIEGPMDSILQKHFPIAKFFNSGVGLELQSVDSKIAEDVLLELANQKIPCVPLHDSFVVPRSFADQLTRAMNGAIVKRFGVQAAFDRKF